MKLSIITINLNNSAGLLKTINSVISQTSKEYEYIIIDGGSIDNSVEIIKYFTDIPEGKYCHLKYTNVSPITYWISEPDHGIYHAINKGILIAKGEYCQFLNSGDRFVAPDVIENMLKDMSDCSIYYGNMLKELPHGKIYRDSCQKGNITMLTLYRGTLNHSPTFIKREMFNKYGLYDEDLKIVSYWKWYINAIGIHNEKLRYIDLDVNYFDMKGISTTDQDLVKQERRMVLEELLPQNILIDYDANWRKIDQSNRIFRYMITRCTFLLVERILFKWEKLMIKFKYLSENSYSNL